MQNLPSILSPDFGLMFWMLLAFLIVFIILAKFGFPIIIKGVEDRKKYIDDAISNAKAANEKLANIKVECDELLKKAREEQAYLIQQGIVAKENIISEAKQKAHDESLLLLNNAKKQIEVEKNRVLKEVRNEVSNLSVIIAEKILRKELEDKGSQEQYIERILNDIK